MTDQGSESGLEVVLDNRKLIIAFVVLIAICGCFFVVGFVEGKRQGYQKGIQAAAESAPKIAADTIPAKAAQPAEAAAGAQAAKEDAGEQRLEWYKNVNRGKGERTQRLMSPEPSKTVSPQPAQTSAKPKAQVASAPAEPVAYSVQVGAFRQRSEAEIKARMLKNKGYECRIEPPGSEGQLYLLKVGKFASRAEAVAMQLRLKKSGFDSFIKTN